MVLVVLAFLAFADAIELRAEEGRRAIVSIEMMESGNYLVPHLHQHPYYNKPPFYNWVLAATMGLLGSVDEWVVRLPGLLCLLAMAAMVYAYPAADRQQRQLAALATLTSGDILFYGSVNAGEIDLFYSALVWAQVWAIFWFEQRSKSLLMFIVSYALAAVGFLTKGLPSLAFQGFTLIAWLFYTRRFAWLIGPAHAAGLVVFAALTVPYFVLYSTAADHWSYLLNIVQQATQRTLTEHTWTDTALALVNFPFYLISKFLPWSALALLLLVKRVRKPLLSRPELAFPLLFIAANLAVYWLSPGIRVRYLYMFIPPISLLAVWAASGVSGGFHRSAVAAVRWVLMGAGTTALVGPVISAWLFPLPHAWFLIPVGLAFWWLALVKVGEQNSWMWTMAIALLVARVGFNVVGLPAVKADQHFMTATSRIENLSGGAPIATVGSYALNPTFELFGRVFIERQLQVPLEMPYSVPYYHYRNTGRVLAYHAERQQGVYYYLHESLLQPTDSVLDRDSAIYRPNSMVLIAPSVP